MPGYCSHVHSSLSDLVGFYVFIFLEWGVFALIDIVDIVRTTALKKPFVISVIGAGGKTTCIERIAEEVRRQGKTAAVVTTTHMWIPEKYSAVGKSWEEAVKQLKEEGMVYYGLAAEAEGKMVFPGQEGYQAVCSAADVVLVEADGAKEKPIKFPDWSREPVIPENTDKIILVFGLSALGRPPGEVCHRWALCQTLLGKEDFDKEKGKPNLMTAQEFVDKELLLFLLQYGYLRRLRLYFPKLSPLVLLNQADDEKKRTDGEWIRTQLEERGIVCRVIQCKSP